MKKLASIIAAVTLAAGVGAQAASACTQGSSYENYIYCSYPVGAILATYTCVDGWVWRQTGWRVLWGCGG